MNENCRNGPLRHRVTYVLGWMVFVALTASLLAPPLPAEDCALEPSHEGIVFPVDRLSVASRCQIAAVVDGYTTLGTFGPVQTPIPRELYVHLLDHPVTLASLVRQLDIANYDVIERGEHTYWVDDGEGTRGELALSYKDDAARIYHMEGHHEGRIFPMVRAKAVVFMGILPIVGVNGQASVETVLVSYTRLNDPLLAGLVRILRPLIGDAVTRKLVRGFRVTNELGRVIADDPTLVSEQAAQIPSIDQDELQTLESYLHNKPGHDTQSSLSPSSP